MSQIDRTTGKGGSSGRAKRSAGSRVAYRRKWVRTAAAKRAPAAASLRDVFRTRRAEKILLVLLLVSLAAHAVVLPVMGYRQAAEGDQVASVEDAYLNRIQQKERAKVVSKDLVGRITMPPPPDDPETFVSKTMADSLSGDIKNVIGNLLDVSISEKIAGKVSASLKDELNAAAQKIAEQKLSQKEIADLQEDFRRKAHGAAQVALQEYRVETQVERAAVSTTQWYEEKVAQVLFTNLKHEMYRRPGWNAGPQIWYRTWSGGNDTPGWHDLRSTEDLKNKLEAIERVIYGHKEPYRDPATGRGVRDEKTGKAKWVLLEYWPGPNLEQASTLKKGMLDIYNRSMGGYKNQEVIPSWNDHLYKGAYSYGLIDEFYPHKEPVIRQQIAGVEALWQKVFQHLSEYVELAEGNAGVEEMKRPQQAFLAAAEELLKEAQKLFPDGRVEQDARLINRALLLEQLRNPALQEQHHKRWLEEMEKTLWPLVQTYAEGQFKEGIIKHDGSVEEALKAFPEQILPLIKHDIERLLPRDMFNRIIFYPYIYTSPITDERVPPSDDDYKGAVAAMDGALKRSPQLAEYAAKRRELLRDHFAAAVTNVVQVTRKHIFARGLLTKRIDLLAEGVDYSDKVQEKLDARKAAKEGRGQDLARLNADGLPDTSARLVALQYGLAHGGLVEPVPCPTYPGYVTESRPQQALWNGQPILPPLPAKWGFETQAQVKKPFDDSPAFETIPYLSRFPRLDGDLTDWGKVRPLILTPAEGNRAQPIVLYAAWNYQGFFFGYKVVQPAQDYYFPEQYRVKADKRAEWDHGGGYTGTVRTVLEKGVDWMTKGDHVRLLFDTLDARSPIRGDPHTQEFVVIPLGSDTDPSIPGFERVIKSKRDAQATEWRRPVVTGNMFLRQPPAEHGPDGTGPFRVTRMDDSGPLDRQNYTVEVFIPRSLFNVPVFAPGWHIGFDCAVATGNQGGRFKGQYWAPWANAVPSGDGPGMSPRSWGDLLLLGTDPYIVIQDADPNGTVSKIIVPGHSYLLTVIDPDRNIYASAKDTVLVSAEVVGADMDMEVFMLTESEPNSGIFRGYINTQPGRGRQVQGAVEALPGQQVRFGYVDIGNSAGKRNVISELRLPVGTPLSNVVAVR